MGRPFTCVIVTMLYPCTTADLDTKAWQPSPCGRGVNSCSLCANLPRTGHHPPSVRGLSVGQLQLRCTRSSQQTPTDCTSFYFDNPNPNLTMPLVSFVYILCQNSTNVDEVKVVLKHNANAKRIFISFMKIPMQPRGASSDACNYKCHVKVLRMCTRCLLVFLKCKPPRKNTCRKSLNNS